jgi:hypothetical protein
MEQSNIHIRLADISDAEQINNLLQRNAPQYVRNRAYWVWIHRLLGCDSSIIAVAYIDDMIVGHYAIIPMEVSIGENTYLAGLGIHALIDKQCSASIMEISNLAYKEAQKRGIRFIYGFPNKNYRLIQERLERWKKIALFNAYEITVNPDILLPENLTWIPAENNYEVLFKLGQLLESGYKNNYIKIKKNIQYYYFRYMNHPQKLYSTFFIYSGDKPAGCLFLKEFSTEDGNTRLHLVDFIKNEDLSYGQIITFCKYYARQINANIISLWPINTEFEKELSKQGFNSIGFDTFFGIKILDNDIDQQVICNFKNWELMMGDSDAI